MSRVAPKSRPVLCLVWARMLAASVLEEDALEAMLGPVAMVAALFLLARVQWRPRADSDMCRHRSSPTVSILGQENWGSDCLNQRRFCFILCYAFIAGPFTLLFDER